MLPCIDMRFRNYVQACCVGRGRDTEQLPVHEMECWDLETSVNMKQAAFLLLVCVLRLQQRNKNTRGLFRSQPRSLSRAESLLFD